MDLFINSVKDLKFDNSSLLCQQLGCTDDVLLLDVFLQFHLGVLDPAGIFNGKQSRRRKFVNHRT